MRPVARIPMFYDVAGLQKQLAANPHLWGEHSNRRVPGSPHAQSTDIWVRYRAQSELLEPKHYGEPHFSSWYPSASLLTAAKFIAFDLMARFQGEVLGGVLLTKLAPGAEIKPHVDDGWHARFYQKFYVAVENGPGAAFHWDGVRIDAREGEVYWFRNDVPHWVVNGSNRNRISMIVCIKTDAPGLQA